MKSNTIGYKIASIILALALLLDIGRPLLVLANDTATETPAAWQIICDVICDEDDEIIESEYLNLSLNPGATVNEMRFTWHSLHEEMQLIIENPAGDDWVLQSAGRPVVAHAGVGVMGADSNLLPTRPGATYFVHQVAVYDLVGGTEYTYFLSWEDEGAAVRSTDKNFRTGAAPGTNPNFQFLIAGDPQIGAGEGLNAMNTPESALDGARWRETLDLATAAFPNAEFILSLGDQVQSANSNNANPNHHIEISQFRHDQMFSSAHLHRLPLLAVVGNHDGWTFDNNNANIRLWPMHYNIPAPDQAGVRGGGENSAHANVFRHRDEMYTQFDYWIRWGDVLFFVLDANGQNDGAHRVMTGERLAFLEDAVAQNADATWRVATWHHPAYSVYRMSHIQEIQQVINNFLPHFERLNFDIILNGHAHVYSRSHHMLGNQIMSEQQFLDANANIVNHETNAVLDPVGIAHIDFNSASGSGFYNVAAMPRQYIATYNQNFHRNFSVADVTEHTFSVRTYQINDDNSRSLVDVYTIVRSDANNNVPAAVTQIPQLDDQTFERITQPEPILLTFADAVTDILAELPTDVGIETNLFNNVTGNVGNVRPPTAISAPYSYGTVVRTPRATITWDIVGSDFDPNNPERQTFLIRGTVEQLPDGIINVANLPQYIYIEVSVLPEGVILPGDIARWMQYPPANVNHPDGMEAYFNAAGGGNARVDQIQPTYGVASPMQFFVGDQTRQFHWSAGAPTVTRPGVTGTNPGSGLNNLAEPAFWHTSFSTAGRSNIEIEFNFRSDPAGGPRDWQVEFSFDNENWAPAGLPIFLSGFWDNNIVRTLPEIADDQDVVYLRWRMASNIGVAGTVMTETARNHMRDIRIRSTRVLGEEIEPDDFDQRIDVLMFNDFHGHIEFAEPVPDNPGAARLAAFIENERQQNPNPNNVIVVSGGDDFHGYAVSTLTNGEPTLALMGYLAANSPAQQESGIHIALGNHEFSFGAARAREFGHHPAVSLLAADLFYAPNMPGNRPDFVAPFDIVEFPDHDITIALVGLMTDTMQNVVSGWGTLGFEARTPAPNNPNEYTAAIAELIEYLRNERGVGAVIGVTHMGGAREAIAYVAENLDFDGLVGGHIHVRSHHRINDTPIIEAAHAGRALGRFSLLFDEAGDLIRVDSWLSEAGAIANFSRDMAVMLGVDDTYDEVTALMQPFLDETYDDLRGPRGPHGVYFNDRASRDMWASRLVLDYVVRWADANGESTDWIGISNGGGWRNTGFWPRNADDPTTMAELISTMPFDNNILLFTMHGQDVLSLINATGLTGVQVRAGIHQDGGNWYVTSSGERILNDRSQEFNVIGSNFIFGGIGEGGGDNYPWPGNNNGNAMGMQVLDPDGPRVVMTDGSTITWNQLQALSTAAADWEGLGVSMIRTALLDSSYLRGVTPNEEWQAELTVSATTGGTAQIASPFAPGDRSRNTNIIPQRVTVTATSTTGFDFVGWFDSNNELVSEDVVYHFTITGNTTLEARFIPGEIIPSEYISIREARDVVIGEVVTVRGIATAVYSTNATNNNAFYLQNPTGSTSSDGILVMLTAGNTAATPPAGDFIGYYVEVTGVRQLPTTPAGFAGVDNINTSGAGHGVTIIEEDVTLPTPVAVRALADLIAPAGASRPFGSMIISLDEPIQIYSLTTTGPGNFPIRGENWPTSGSGAMNGNNPAGPPRMYTNSAVINAQQSQIAGFNAGDWVYVDRAVVHWWSGRTEIQLRLIPGDMDGLRLVGDDDPTPTALTVEEARAVETGQTVTVHGVVTTNYAPGVAGNGFFLQSPTGTTPESGILVRVIGATPAQLAAFAGREVEVTGTRNGNVAGNGFVNVENITVAAITNIEDFGAAELPTPVTVTAEQLRNRAFQSMLVTLVEPVEIAGTTTGGAGDPNRAVNVPGGGNFVVWADPVAGAFNVGDAVVINRAVIHWWQARDEVQFRTITGDANAILPVADDPVLEEATIVAWASEALGNSHDYEAITGPGSFAPRWNPELGVSANPGTAWLNFVAEGSRRTLAAGSGGINAGSSLAEGMYWHTEISTIGYEEVNVDWNFRSTGTGPRDFQLQYRLENENWNNVGEPIVIVNVGGNPATVNVGSHFTRTLPTTAQNQPTVELRWIIMSNTAVNGNAIAAAGTNQIGNIRISGMTEATAEELGLLEDFDVDLPELDGTEYEVDLPVLDESETAEVTAEDAELEDSAASIEIEEVIIAASVVYAHPDPDPNRIETVTKTLLATVETQTIDTNELKDLFTVIYERNLVETEYTPESWLVFINAVGEACALLINQDALQDEIDNMYNVLLAALNGLVRVDTDNDNITVEWEDNNSDFTIGEDEPLVFIINGATVDEFIAVYVDGIRLSDSDFNVEAGSIRITLLPIFLNTLAPGRHNMQVYLTNYRIVATYFTIHRAEQDVEEVTVTFIRNYDANDNTILATRFVEIGETVALPTAPTRAGYTFVGWFTARTGGTELTATTVVTVDMNVYARWIPTGGGGLIPHPPGQPDPSPEPDPDPELDSDSTPDSERPARPIDPEPGTEPDEEPEPERPTLPQTGVTTSVVPLITGLAGINAAVGVVITKKKTAE